MFLGNVAQSLLGILLVVLLARYLGATEYGKYAFALSFTAIFLVLTDMGLSTLSIREIARDTRRADEYFTTISVTKLVLSIIMMSAIAIVVNLMGHPQDTVLVVYLFGAIHVFGSFAVFFRSIFRAFEKMEYEALTRIIERVLVVGTGLAALLQGNGLRTVVLTMLAAQTVGCLLTLVVCVRRFARPRLAFDFALARNLLRTALPFALASVFASILFHTDSVMLSVMKGDAVVGWYNAASRPVLGTFFLPSVFVGAVFPVLSRYYVTAKYNLITLYGKSLKYLAALAIPLGIGTTLIAGRVIFVLYGQEYGNSVIVLQILAWSVSLMFVTTLLGHTLASIDRQAVDMRIAATCAVLNVILNLSLIPGLSYTGAAIASVTSQVVIFTAELGYLQKRLHRVSLLRILYKPLGAAVVMGVLVYSLDRFLGTTALSLAVIILGAIAIYGLCLYLFKTFDREDLQAMRSIFRRSITKGESDESG